MGENGGKSVGQILQNKGLLSTFWTLAEGNDKKRIQTTHDLVQIIDLKQGKEESVCSELDYTIKRLIKGLASTRKWARIGFVTALTQILREFSVLKFSYLLNKINENLKISKTSLKSEQSNIWLGKVFAYLALIQSGKLPQASDGEIVHIVKGLLQAKNKKQHLHHLCTQALQLVIDAVPEATFKEKLMPLLEANLQIGWSENTAPDDLLLTLSAAKCHSGVINKKFMSKHWGSKHLISEANVDSITIVMGKTTADHPIIHSVCTTLVQEAAKKEDTCSLFWGSIIDKLLQGTSPQKKYMCLKLVPVGLSHCKSSSQVRAVLSDTVINTLYTNMTKKDRVVASVAQEVTKGCVKYVEQCTDGALQVAVLLQFIKSKGSILFDSITKTGTLGSFIRSLNKEGSMEFSTLLMRVITGEEEMGQDIESSRRWSLQHLSNMVIQVSMTTEREWQLSIVQFLFLHSYFDILRVSSKIPHCDKICTLPLAPHVRFVIHEACTKALNKLAAFKQAGKNSGRSPYTEVLYGVAKYVQVLLSSDDNVRVVNEIPKEAREHWNKCLKIVEKLRTKHSDWGGVEAFELLFLHLSLQLFTDHTAAIEALQDLYICHEKALQKNKRKSVLKLDPDEPGWVLVLTEMLLSLLSQQSHHVRMVVNNAFRLLTPHLNEDAIQIILEVFVVSEDGPLDFEDDMEEEASEGGDGSEGGPTEDEEDSEEDSSNEDEEEDVDSENEVDEKMRAQVKAALGDAAVDSDAESSIADLSDDEMLKRDDMLASVFKAMSKGQKAEKLASDKQVRDYKLRCLDLIQILIQQELSAKYLLLLVNPLLGLVDAGLKDNSLHELGTKAKHVLQLLCKPRKLSLEGVDTESLPQVIKDLISYSTKVTGVPIVLEVASAVLFVIRLMLGLSNNVTPVKTRSQRSEGPKGQEGRVDVVHTIMREAVRDYCERREIALNHMLLHSIFERQPTVMWPLAKDLLLYVKKQEIRVFCKTQVCSMLSAMVNKQTVSALDEDTCRELMTNIYSDVNRILSEMSEDKQNLKPKFAHELLLVLHRVFSSSSDDHIKAVVDESFLGLLDTLRNMGDNKDVRNVCNKLSGLLTTRLMPAGKLKNKKSKRKHKNSQSEAVPEKRERKDEDASVTETNSTEKQQEKKKNRKHKKKESAESIKSEPEAQANVNGDINVKINGNSVTTKKKKSKNKFKKEDNSVQNGDKNSEFTQLKSDTGSNINGDVQRKSGKKKTKNR